jgi:2-polyprenyl-3-methyl-5-hydroxy-6-metoxy-1,4-benzoquinol methylase
MRTLLILAALAVAAPAAALEPHSSQASFQLAQAQKQQPPQRTQSPDVIYVPTPQEVVDEMLKLADVKKGDVLYDLGSGDGRIPVTAAKKFGIRAIGIDIDPTRIREANDNAKKNGVTNLVQFRNEDLFKADFKEATVVTLYLLPDLNVKLRPRLWAELKPGTRVVSHQFDMGDWKPQKTVELGGRTIYFWTVPERKQPANK